MKRREDGTALVRIGRATVDVLEGEDLSTWDDAELLAGRRYDKDRKFRGRKPKVVAAACLQELNRRRFARAADTLADSLVDGAEALRSIITDETVDPATRISGIKLLYERVLGIPRQSIDLHASVNEKPYERLIASSIVPTVADALRLMREERDGEVVDGEIVVKGSSVTPPAKKTVRPKSKARDRSKPRAKTRSSDRRSKRDEG
jgi:hypothetical protein